MGAKTLSERLGMSEKEAQEIIDSFYEGFEGVKQFTKESQEMAEKYGYVTDIFGRRRHLPDATLPKFEVNSKEDTAQFNPFLGCEDRVDKSKELLINQYTQKLNKAKWKNDIDKIKKDAERDGLEVKNNGGFISRALRQTLNSRIQGTAASMTKLAMIMLDNDERLKKLGFRLLCTVHDEVFGECPTENAEECSKLVSEVMIKAAKVKCGAVKWKCDGYSVSRWYIDELMSKVQEDYEKIGFEEVCKKYSHISEDALRKFCDGTYDQINDDKI